MVRVEERSFVAVVVFVCLFGGFGLGVFVSHPGAKKGNKGFVSLRCLQVTRRREISTQYV